MPRTAFNEPPADFMPRINRKRRVRHHTRRSRSNWLYDSMFMIGNVVARPDIPDREFLIIEDAIPLSTEKSLVLVHLGQERRLKRRFPPFDLWVLNYRVMRNLPFDRTSMLQRRTKDLRPIG